MVAGLEFEGEMLSVVLLLLSAGRRGIEEGFEEFGGVVEGRGKEHVASCLEAGYRRCVEVVEGGCLRSDPSGQREGDGMANRW